MDAYADPMSQRYHQPQQAHHLSTRCSHRKEVCSVHAHGLTHRQYQFHLNVKLKPSGLSHVVQFLRYGNVQYLCYVLEHCLQQKFGLQHHPRGTYALLTVYLVHRLTVQPLHLLTHLGLPSDHEQGHDHNISHIHRMLIHMRLQNVL
ncbi:Uncharacterised protein [Acinetobacter baumannii]|nr:Uncharacterised protein [Acinetobacter baumannii]